MSMSDPVADLCTRIRNSVMRKHATTIVPYSVIKKNIVAVLQQEGFIEGWKIKNAKPSALIVISLKYYEEESVIRTIKRISKPGRRIHSKVNDMKPILGGQGIAVVTTSKGVLSDKDCHRLNVGGEVLCHIW